MRMFKSIIIVAGVCFIALSFVADRAFAETRTCRAWYEVKVISVNDARVNRKAVTVANFHSRGNCRNRFSANECRRVARDFAHKCMDTHWNSADGNDTPRECQELQGLGVYDYNIRNLKQVIKTAVCSSLMPSDYKNNKAIVVYSLVSGTSGDTGCPQRKEIIPGACECSK